jgi:hypothetical protein
MALVFFVFQFHSRASCLTHFFQSLLSLSRRFIEFLESTTVCEAGLNKAGLQKISFAHLNLRSFKETSSHCCKKQLSLFKAAAAALLCRDRHSPMVSSILYFFIFIFGKDMTFMACCVG